MKKEEPGIKEVKIILLGDSGVGKTSIINRYVNQSFNNDVTTSLGSRSFEKEIRQGKTLYKLNIWDTTGQEKYHSLTNLFIKKSGIVILVYSIDSIRSFQGLNYWYNCAQERLENKKYILAVIGNKSDIIDGEGLVSEEDGKRFAQEKNCFFKLVSAKEDPEGINSLFETLFEEFIKCEYDFYENSMETVKLNKEEKEGKKKCC